MSSTRKPTRISRDLRLVSPLLKGPDIRALQHDINKGLHHRKFEWRRVKADAQFGPRTRHAAHFYGWLIGLSGSRLRAIQDGRITKAVQEILRDPSKRSRLDRLREKSRKAHAQEIRHTHKEGPKAAIAYIRKMAEKGVHEIGETNTGPMVDKWEGYFGLHAEPWCGCLAGYAAIVEGNCIATALHYWYGYDLITEGNARVDGSYTVGFDEIEGGEILVLWGGEHVVTAAGKSKGDTVPTGEGNTSPTNGDNQADGGAVAMKTRSRSDVTCAIRVYG